MRRPKLALIMSAIISAVTAQQALSDGTYVPAGRGVALYNWSGLYAGLHLGGTWGTTGAFDNLGYNLPPGGGAGLAQVGPFLGGGTVGMLVRRGSWPVVSSATIGK